MIRNKPFGYKLRQILVMVLVSFTLTQFARGKEIVVSAAVSLSDAFKDIAKIYEIAHPQDKILFNFAASGSLLQQIIQGAPVDLFASADEETMNLAQQQNMIDKNSRRDFICNHLVLVTSTHNGWKIKHLSDLTQPFIKRIAIGQVASVPAGHYTQQALQAAGLWQKLQEKLIPAQNVRQVLDYVARGEVDAGFVYESDASILVDKIKILTSVPLPTSVQYPIASIRNSQHTKQAQAFMDLVLSAQGQKILQKYGFSACHF